MQRVFAVHTVEAASNVKYERSKKPPQLPVYYNIQSASFQSGEIKQQRLTQKPLFLSLP